LAVQVFIKFLGISRQGGYYKAQIGTLNHVLRLYDHPSFLVPGFGCVSNKAKDLLFFSRSLEGDLDPFHVEMISFLQHRNTLQTQDIVHAMAFAPAHEAPATEARIPAENNTHLGPDFAKLIDQQFQNRPGVLGPIDAAFPQLSDQQLLPAENIKR